MPSINVDDIPEDIDFKYEIQDGADILFDIEKKLRKLFAEVIAESADYPELHARALEKATAFQEVGKRIQLLETNMKWHMSILNELRNEVFDTRHPYADEKQAETRKDER